MAESKLTADALVLSDPIQSRGVVHATMSQPTASDERALGRLFFVFALDQRMPQAEEIFHKLQTTVTETYYRNREGTAELNFEKAIQEGNQALRLFINERNRGLIEQLHVVIGVISGNEIILSSAGRNHLFLARGPRIIDIIERQEKNSAGSVRIFSHLLSGELRLGDRVLACTNSVLDYVSIEKLRQIISGTPTAHAAFTLEQILKDSPPAHSFAAIVFGVTGVTTSLPAVVPDRTQTTPAPVMAQSSMAELQARSRATSELLTPSFWQVIKSTAGDLINRLGNLIRTRVLRRRPRRTVDRPTDVITYRSPMATPRISNSLVRSSRRVAGGIIGTAKAFGATVGDIIQRRRSVGDSIRRFPQRTNENINRTVSSYQRLTKGQKRLLVSAGILLLIFAGSIVWRGIGKEADINENQKAELTTSIEQKIFQASSALTYGDDSGAITLLDEAVALVDTYPNSRKTDRDQRDAWLERITKERDKTKHITQLGALTTFADFGAASLANPIGEILRIGTVVYAITTDQLVSIDNEGTVTQHNFPEHTGTVNQLAASGQNIVLILTDSGQMIEYTISTNSFRTIDVPFTNQDRTIADMATYETRVYFLDAKNNEIYRHTRASNGYSLGQAWINDADVSVADAAGFAVDGTIYTVSRGGTVTKLFQGTRAGDFSADHIEPALTTATAIWTDTDAQNIYILDPSGHRVVVLTKAGALKAQYAADQLGDARAFAVNQAETTVYILTNTAVLSFPLN